MEKSYNGNNRCIVFPIIFYVQSRFQYTPGSIPSWIQTHYINSIFVKTDLGAVSIRKTVLPGMAIPMLKIRRPNGPLIFNMEIAIRR